MAGTAHWLQQTRRWFCPGQWWRSWAEFDVVVADSPPGHSRSVRGAQSEAGDKCAFTELKDTLVLFCSFIGACFIFAFGLFVDPVSVSPHKHVSQKSQPPLHLTLYFLLHLSTVSPAATRLKTEQRKWWKQLWSRVGWCVRTILEPACGDGLHFYKRSSAGGQQWQSHSRVSRCSFPHIEALSSISGFRSHFKRLTRGEAVVCEPALPSLGAAVKWKGSNKNRLSHEYKPEWGWCDAADSRWLTDLLTDGNWPTSLKSCFDLQTWTHLILSFQKSNSTGFTEITRQWQK